MPTKFRKERSKYSHLCSKWMVILKREEKWGWKINKLKADRPHPRDKSTHRQTPRTDNDFSLLFVALGKAEPLISTAARQRFDLDLWTRPLTLNLKQVNSEVKTRFLAFDLDLWPTTLTYNSNLAKVKVDLHTKNRGRRSNGSALRALTNTRTDPNKCIISPFRGP